MEVAGSILGVVGAVGVLGQVFDGCVKAYAYFTAVNNLGRDSERLLCKVRIEEMRLMVWGREWGVKEGKLEAHLAAANGENDGLKKLAELILQQLLDTIGNTKKLKERYGVKENPVKGEEVDLKAKNSDATGWGDFKLKARWIIGDRDKFELLLRDLKDFNDGLERLFPPSRIATLHRAWQNELLQTAKRDVGQLNLLESASVGVYPQLNNSASLKQLRINLDAQDSTKFQPSSKLKIPPAALAIPVGQDRRVMGKYSPVGQGSDVPVMIEWIKYDGDMDLDERLVLYQRVDNLARMIQSASNRHPDLHTLDCVGYIDDSSQTRYGLVYGVPKAVPSDTPRTLDSIIEDPQLRTPDLNERFDLAITLSIALWSCHSLDWLHKSFCSSNILFFHEPDNLAHPFVTGFDSARPDHLTEMTVASRNDSGQELYRHPDSLGVWRQSYRKSFDIYSLGLVLLEIGLWKCLKEFHRPKFTPSTFRDKAVLPALVPRLGSKTGRKYQEIVERCLKHQDPADTDGAGKLLEWVVLNLEDLRV